MKKKFGKILIKRDFISYSVARSVINPNRPRVEASQEELKAANYRLNPDKHGLDRG